MMSTQKEKNLTGPGVSDPQGPADRESGPGSLPSSSYDGLTQELPAGSWVELATAEGAEAPATAERGAPSLPRVISEETGVFLLPRQGSRRLRGPKSVREREEANVREMGKPPTPLADDGSSGEDTGDDTEHMEDESPVSPPAKIGRKRGRPPTHGRFVGIRERQQRLKELKWAEDKEKARKDLEGCVEEARATRASRPLIEIRGPLDSGTPLGTAALLERVGLDVRTVEEISRRSKNLKGTFQRGLTDAVASIREAVSLLARTSASDETARLERELSSLREDNNSLRRELEEVRRQMRIGERRARASRRRPNSSPDGSVSSDGPQKVVTKGGAPPPPSRAAPPTPTTAAPGGEEKLVARLMTSLGAMMDAKLAALEERLPPEPPGKFRPPLAASAGRREAFPSLPKKPDKQAAKRTAAKPPPQPSGGGKTTGAGSTPGGRPSGGAKGTAVPTQPRNGAPARSAGPAKEEGRGAGKGQKAKPAPKTAERPTARLPPAKGGGTNQGGSASATAAPSGEWTEVIKRGRRREGAATAAAGGRPTAPPGKAFAPTSRGGKGGKTAPPRPSALPLGQRGKKESARPRRARRPRAAAITITLPPEAEEKGETYARLLARAKSSIALEDLGITALRMRKAFAGGRVLEVPGEEGAYKADALARRLGEVLADTGARVARPVKTAELRVVGLEESATPSEVAGALAGAGGCAPSEVRLGPIRPGPAGMGTAWAQCPVAAANRLATAGRLMVGWTTARVHLLSARPLQCYRCLALGHARAQCPVAENVDRSGACFRCGQTGHKAAECSAAAKCPVCEEHGRPSGHRCGGRACKPPPKKKKEKGKGGAANTALAPPAATKGGPSGAPPTRKEEGAAPAAPTEVGGDESPPPPTTAAPLEEAMDTAA